MVTPLDGNPPAGDPESPTPAASQGQGQLSKDDIQALIDRLDATEKQVKGLQKGTDKQIGQVRDDIKRILELKDKGLDETQIHRELLIDQVLAGQSAPPAPVEGNQPEVSKAFDVETVVKAMDFPENDVAVAAVKKAYADNPQTLISELAKLKVAQVSVKPAGPAGALPPSGGQTVPNQKGQQELTSDYKKEMLAAPRGPSGDIKRREIKNRYIQLGVPIQSVDFTS